MVNSKVPITKDALQSIDKKYSYSYMHIMSFLPLQDNSCRVFNIQNHRKDFHNSEVKNIYIVTCYINVYIVSHISYKAKGSLVQFLSKLPLTS